MLVKGTIVSGILVNIESGSDSLPDRHQAPTRTNVDIFSIERIGTDLSEIWIILHRFSLKKKNLKFRVMQKQLLETVLTKIFVVIWRH